MRTPLFTGVCPALVTPFHKSGGIDFSSFAHLIEHQISAGVDAVCVCGTTGESSTLSEQEYADLVSFCVHQVSHRVKVIVGSGSNNTAAAVRRSELAQELGADALLIVTPYYNKTTQIGLVQHYKSIAGQTDLPILLYNVPSRTGLSFTAETYARLAEVPNINGVKEASGNLSLVVRTLHLCPDDFYIWSGNDEQVVPLMSLGAKGVISVASNLIPEIMVLLSHACLDGNFARASSLQTEYAVLIDALFAEVNPIPVKAAMEQLGMCSDTVRLPLVSCSSATRELLKCELSQRGLL